MFGQQVREKQEQRTGRASLLFVFCHIIRSHLSTKLHVNSLPPQLVSLSLFDQWLFAEVVVLMKGCQVTSVNIGIIKCSWQLTFVERHLPIVEPRRAQQPPPLLRQQASVSTAQAHRHHAIFIPP